MTDQAKARDRVASSAAPDDDGGYALEDQIGHLLRRAHQRASAIFMEKMGDARLTPTQYAALVKIRDEGEVSQNQLGRLTAMDPATIKGVVERLAGRGLVASHRDPTNQRRLILTLTATGSRIVEACIPTGREISEATLAPLSAGDRRKLVALLKRLG